MRTISTLLRAEDWTDEEMDAVNDHYARRLSAARERGWRGPVACPMQPNACHNGLDRGAACWALEMGGDPGFCECSVCGGNSRVWVSPSGRTALRPGGPFTGYRFTPGESAALDGEGEE